MCSLTLRKASTNDREFAYSVKRAAFKGYVEKVWGWDETEQRLLHEERFLKHNIQGALFLAALNPVNLFLLPTSALDKSDLSARYYDKHIFQGATYEDLMVRGQRPFIIINATDMNRQEHFIFTQRSFSLLGSDLSALGLSCFVRRLSTSSPRGLYGF